MTKTELEQIIKTKDEQIFSLLQEIRQNKEEIKQLKNFNQHLEKLLSYNETLAVALDRTTDSVAHVLGNICKKDNLARLT